MDDAPTGEGLPYHGMENATTRARRRLRTAPPALRVSRKTTLDGARRPARDPVHNAAREFDRLVSELAVHLGRVRWDKVDDLIHQSMRAACTFAEAQHCVLITIDRDTATAVVSHQASQGEPVPNGTVLPHPTSTPWLYDRLVNRTETISFRSLDHLPPEASIDRRALQERGTRAALYIPYPAFDAKTYVLALVYRGRECDSLPRMTERCAALGGVFVACLARKFAGQAEEQARRRLANARRFSQSALDALNKCIGVVDPAGTLVQASNQWCAFGARGGVGPERIPVGDNYLQALEASTGTDRARASGLARGLSSVLRGDSERFEMAWTLRPHDGELAWIQTRVSPFVVDGSTYAAIAHDDVSEIRSREQELEELRSQHWHSERITRTGVLVSSLSHELSQPVAAILSNAQAALRLLAAEACDAAENREILADIVADCKRAGNIIESLRLMLRRQKAKPRPVDLAEVVVDVVRLLHTECLSRQVEVERECETGCIALADRTQIQQVVLNLMMNGIEAMSAVPPGERVLRVTVHAAARGQVQLAVQDAGVGIRQAELEKVFSAFWTTKSRGTGMGLAICRSIIDSHRGRIWVEPNAGPGSTFHVALPAAGLARGANASDDRVHPGTTP